MAVATKDSTAPTAAECLLDNVLLRYNFPSRLISDNATSFHSEVMKEINNLFKIKKIFTTPYHPQSNIVERSHRTLDAYMRAFTSAEKNSWPELLKFAYNNSVHSSTGYTPHELAHGFRIQIPTHLTKQKLSYNYDNLASNIRNNIAKALEMAKNHLTSKKLSNKKYYDSNAHEFEISENDLVLLKTQTKNNKFQEIYEGPYRVVQSHKNFVEIRKNGRIMKVHKNLLKRTVANEN